MAVQRFKLALNAATFPLLSTHASRSVCIPALDGVARTPRTFMGSDENIDYNIPQIIYCENVLPTRSGIKSVGYQQVIAPTVNNDFDSIFPLRDADENTVLYSPSHGKNYIYDDVLAAWSTEDIPTIWGLTLAAGSVPADSKVTYAYVDGKTFVCYSRLQSTTAVDMSIMQWDAATKSLIPATSIITNLPFAVGEIDGISSSSGYLLVWSGLTIAWAPFNGAAFNFEIYSSGNFTGAGYQIPEDVQGPITAIIGMPGGFIAFTTRNAIGASYHAQSIAAPWVFREIPDAGGMDNYEQATVEGSLGKLIAYTTSGMQSLSLNSAELAFPAVSDFIAARSSERYDFGNHTLVQGAVSTDLFTKLTAVGNRYIVISYGYYPGTFSFALVYDLGLKRWGKVRIVHRDCFYYTQKPVSAGLTYAMLLDVSYADTAPETYAGTNLAPERVTAAQHALAFMKSTGEVVLGIWSDESRAEDEAVAIIGRVQLTRTSNTQLNTVEAEGLKSGEIEIMPSYDGRTLAETQVLTTIESVGDFRKAGGMISCKNFNVVIEGTFDLSTLILEGTTTGKF
jgi:hypothetical protein